MTEQAWLESGDVGAMLKFLRDHASDRKFRLFACACCRRHRNLLRSKKNLRVLEACEDYADGRISREVMNQERNRWYTFDSPFPLGNSWQAALSSATLPHSKGWTAANDAASISLDASRKPKRDRLIQVGLLREIFGNPFRPLAVDPSWLTSTVVALAEGIYKDRAFDRLPILADALMDAGCDNDEILTHCRSEGQHVRGCWLVDLFTGRK